MGRGSSHHPHIEDEKTGSERLGNWLKVTQLIRGRRGLTPDIQGHALNLYASAFLNLGRYTKEEGAHGVGKGELVG